MNSITILYRKKQEGRYSIERLFSPIDNLEGVTRVELPYDLTSVLNAFKLLLFSFKIKSKTIHITGDVNYMAFLFFWKNIIITVHDTYHYEGMKGIKKQIYGLIWFRVPLLLSNQIVVISPNTKERLINQFKIKSFKIKVIPNSIILKDDNSNVLRETKEFSILVIGTKQNKNLHRLITALDNIKNVKVDIIGNVQQSTLSLLNKYDINFELNHDISNQELIEKFKSSNLLYMASIQEGFGLPILEAQEMNLLVLTSSISPMDYVAGKGAVYVNPFSVDDIRQKILQVKNKEIDIEKILSEGKENVKRFSLENFIYSYKEIYSKFK